MKRCRGFVKTCLLACVASSVFAQSDAPQGQGPTANLPEPRVAEFRLLDRNGRANDASVEMLREGRYFVEGATLSAGQWRLQGLDANRYPENVAVQIDVTIARQPFQEFKPDHLAAITLASPKSPLKSTQILFPVSATSPLATVIIPRRVELLEDGRRRTGDVFDDLSAGGEIVVLVTSVERGVFLGMSPTGISVLRNDTATARQVAEVNGAFAPYETAMEACRLVWKRYESRISEVPSAGQQQRFIPLKDELQIRDELNHVLRGALGKLERRTSVRDEQQLLKAASLRLLLDDVTGARRILVMLIARNPNRLHPPAPKKTATLASFLFEDTPPRVRKSSSCRR